MIAEKKCATCAKYLNISKSCEDYPGIFEPDFVCDAWKGDFMQVCGICGGAAVEMEETDGAMCCSENANHMVCMWDGQWFDTSK